MVGTDLRAVVLVDADNLEIEKRGEPRRRIDYRALLNQMYGGNLARAIYYRPFRGFPASHRATVERAGFEIVTTPKNSDSWFICDAMSFAQKYDVVVFVGGDGGLEPVIPMLKTRGVRVEVWSWEGPMAERLKDLVDNYVTLDDIGILWGRNGETSRRTLSANSGEVMNGNGTEEGLNGKPRRW